MRLLTKTTLYYVTVSLFIFFVCGIGIYQLVKRLEDQKVKQELTNQMHRISFELKSHKSDIKDVTIVSGGLIQMQHTHVIENPPVHFADTLILDPMINYYAPFKSLSFYVEFQGILYKTTIYKSMIESNYLIEQVALIVTIIVIVFLLAVYFLYRYIFGRIWSDFFDTINKIQHFDLSSPEQISFPKSMIIEFNELNEVLKKMIDRINSDYQGLREFSGNLTHEIQTPLAVIKSKAGLLLQDAQINENQMILAGEINKETTRISRLIKALSMFTKLDHHQFHNRQLIEIKNIINSKLKVFEDFIDNKKLSIQLKLEETPAFEMNLELADVLFTNLIKNAIRHNISEGRIEIQTGIKSFSIKNTGYPINFDPNLLFERFSKASRNSDSLGIGLSIAKKICDYYGFRISYVCNENIHTISLDLNSYIN